jgi:hypothetical protein
MVLTLLFYGYIQQSSFLVRERGGRGRRGLDADLKGERIRVFRVWGFRV